MLRCVESSASLRACPGVEKTSARQIKLSNSDKDPGALDELLPALELELRELRLAQGGPEAGLFNYDGDGDGQVGRPLPVDIYHGCPWHIHGASEWKFLNLDRPGGLARG